MSHVENVTKVKFGTLPLQQKLEIKRLGTHQPKNFNIIQSGKHKICSFNPKEKQGSKEKEVQEKHMANCECS